MSRTVLPGRNKRYAAARLFLHNRHCNACDPAQAAEHARLWHDAARALVLSYDSDDPYMWRWVQNVHATLCPDGYDYARADGRYGAVEQRQASVEHERKFADSDVVRALRAAIEAAA
ncbi:hypothetical protein [Nonomuraea sp. NPDC050202]|uniref:hypothetical protein n=1 Tax=Nonomuraea sp. NPDC050202 TaxID=3155035 RepID=UPI0033FEC779